MYKAGARYFIILGCLALCAGCAASGKAVVEQYQEVTPTRFEGAVAVVLAQDAESQVDHEGKTMVLEWFVRTKIMDRRAMDCGEDAPNCRLTRWACYNETWDEVESIEARTITPEGEIIKVDSDDMIDQTFSTWAFPDQDQRCFVWQMKGAVPGSIFEERVRIRSKAILVPGGLWFQGLDPVLESVFTISAPADYKYRWKVYNADIQPTEKKTGDRIVRTWTARDMPPIQLEDGMVAPDDLVAKLVVVNEYVSAFDKYKSCHSIKTWEDAGRCWTEMIADRQKVTDPIKETAEKIAKAAKTETDKVKAVWDWMNNNVRYVGLERGLAGWIPLSAHVVCTKQYGDCKAVAGLISVLCRELGLKADPISIGTRPSLGSLDLELPGFFYFNHSIARVEADGKVYWLDATNRYLDFKTTSYHNQGVHVLVSRPGEPFVDFIPVQPAETNLQVSKALFVPTADGGMHLEYEDTRTGNAALMARYMAHELVGERYWNFIQEELAKAYAQAKFKEHSYSGKDDNNLPFSHKIAVDIPRALQPAGRGVSFTVAGLPFKNLIDSFNPPKRRHPLDLLFKRMFKDRIEVQIPKGMQLAGLPRNVMYEDEYFKLERLAQIEGDRLVAVYTMVQKVLNVSPDKYPAARKSFHKALDARSFVLLFEPEKKKKKS